MHVSSESLLHIRRQVVGWQPRRVVEFMTAVVSPEIIILLILCMVLGVLPPAANPYLRLAGKGLYPSDLMLISLLGMVGLRLLPERHFRFVRTPLDVPLPLLLRTVLFAVLAGITAHGITFSDATNEARSLLYYALFFYNEGGWA